MNANNTMNITRNDIDFAEVQSEIKSLNECAKRYTEQKAGFMHREGHVYPTKVLEEIAKYGAENIFEYVEDYHGKYEDDYCTFVYINNVTGETFSDYWTTAGACPNFGLYECVHLQKAVSAGLPINPSIYESFRKVVRGEAIGLLSIYDNVRNYHETNPQIGRLVSIDRGRKWKGTGYLMEIRHSSFHPAGRYSAVDSYTAVIYDPSDNTIHEANAQYAKYADQEQFKAEFEAWVDQRLEGTTLADVLPNFHSFNYNMVSKCHPCVFYREYIERHPMPDTTNANYPERDARNAKKQEKINKLRADLEVWASRFTDKTPEERAKMVERALAKQDPELE